METEQRMNDQRQHDRMATKNGSDFEMGEAILQPPLQIQASEKQLKNQKAGEGNELLLFESDLRNFVVLCMNLCFAGLHLWWLPE